MGGSLRRPAPPASWSLLSLLSGKSGFNYGGPCLRGSFQAFIYLFCRKESRATRPVFILETLSFPVCCAFWNVSPKLGSFEKTRGTLAGLSVRL